MLSGAGGGGVSHYGLEDTGSLEQDQQQSKYPQLERIVSRDQESLAFFQVQCWQRLLCTRCLKIRWRYAYLHNKSQKHAPGKID